MLLEYLKERYRIRHLYKSNCNITISSVAEDGFTNSLFQASSFRFDSGLLKQFRNDRDKLQFICAGTAAGKIGHLVESVVVTSN